MADGRLGLMRHELDAVRMRQCNAAHQAGDPAHLDDVGLHHADPGSDQIGNAGERIGLLPGRDRDVELACDLAHRLDMVVLDRLLEPPIAEFFQRAPNADGAAHRVAVIGVKGERQAVAHQPPHGACLGDVARDVDVGLGPVVVKTDLHRRRLVFEPGFDHPQHIVDTALAIAADRGVERQAGAPGAAEKLVDRLAQELALEVPQRNVEGRERAAQGSLWPELGESME